MSKLHGEGQLSWSLEHNISVKLGGRGSVDKLIKEADEHGARKTETRINPEAKPATPSVATSRNGPALLTLPDIQIPFLVVNPV